ncbi:MAG: hypothetical protein M3Q30_23120 [Actinomycetota bacterium]|nr:hypothetical protein [Actinomycetota bacterium]
MRLRTTIAAAAAAAVASIGVVMVTPAYAASSAAYTCTGTLANPPSSFGVIPAGTYRALNLPAGSACVINGPGDVNVLSPVVLGSGAVLAMFGGSLEVHGGVTVGPNAIFAVPQNSTPVTINGPVNVQSVAVFLVGVETPQGPLFSSIRGGVTATDASSVQIHNTTISGGVTSQDGGADNAAFDALANQGFPQNFFALEDNHINGRVIVNGYEGEWGGVIRDTINGGFTFTDNVQAVNPDEWDIGSLAIHGPATCANNSPAPNVGESPAGPSTVSGPTRGNQAATCTSAA